MKEIVCENCGARELDRKDGFYVCRYCGSKFRIEKEEKTSEIELNEDVAALLKKWDENPERAERYARLILEIDPGNPRAKAYLAGRENVGGCYVATAVYGSYDCPPVWTLRRYRDNILATTFFGRTFIHAYYAVSPALVRQFGGRAWFSALWRPVLDRKVWRLNRRGVEDTPYRDRMW